MSRYTDQSPSPRQDYSYDYLTTVEATVKPVQVPYSRDFIIMPEICLEGPLVLGTELFPKDSLTDEQKKDPAHEMVVYAKWGEELKNPVWLVGPKDASRGDFYNYHPYGDPMLMFSSNKDAATMPSLTRAVSAQSHAHQSGTFAVDPADSGRKQVHQPEVRPEEGVVRPKAIAATARWMYSDDERAEYRGVPKWTMNSRLKKHLGAVMALAALGFGASDSASDLVLNHWSQSDPQEPVTFAPAVHSERQKTLTQTQDAINDWLKGSELFRDGKEYQQFKRDRAALLDKIDEASSAEELETIARQDLGIGFLILDDVDLSRQKAIFAEFADVYKTLIPESEATERLTGLSVRIHCDVKETVMGSYSEGVICQDTDDTNPRETIIHELAHWTDDKYNYSLSDVMAELSQAWGPYKGAEFDSNNYEMTEADLQYFDRAYGMVDQLEDLGVASEPIIDSAKLRATDSLPAVRKQKLAETLTIFEANYPGFTTRLTMMLEAQNDSSESAFGNDQYISMLFGMAGALLVARQSALRRKREKNHIFV